MEGVVYSKANCPQTATFEQTFMKHLTQTIPAKSVTCVYHVLYILETLLVRENPTTTKQCHSWHESSADFGCTAETLGSSSSQRSVIWLDVPENICEECDSSNSSSTKQLRNMSQTHDGNVTLASYSVWSLRGFYTKTQTRAENI